MLAAVPLRTSLLLYILCSGAATSVHGSRCTSGAKAALTQNFIQRAKEAAIDWLVSWLPEQKFSKQTSVSVLTLHNFYDIQIQDGYQFDLVMQQPTGYKTSSIALTAKLSLKLQSDFDGPLWCSGTLYPTVNDVSVDFVVEFSLDSGGLVLHVDTDSVSVGDIDITTHGCWYSWIVDAVASFLKTSITNGITNGIQNAVPKIIDGVDKALQTFEYQIPVPFPAPFNNAIFDFHLCNAEVKGAGDTAFLRFGVTGDVRDSRTPNKTASLPYAAALPDLIGELEQHFVNLELSNYSVDTLLYTYFHQGVLNYAVHRAALPAGVFGDVLNTDFYKVLMPELYLKYPHLNMTMLLNISGLPATTIEEDELLARADIDFCFQVDDSAGQIPVFNLTCSGVLAGSVSVNATRGPIALLGTLKEVTGCAMSEKWSGFGQLVPELLSVIEDAANDVFKVFLIPLANKYLRVDVKPIELKDPNAGKAVYVSFLNGTIDEKSGYGLIATNASAVVQSSSLERSNVEVLLLGTSNGAPAYV